MTAEPDTRLRILEVATEGLRRFGPRRLTLVDLATLAGVSRPTLYRHFASKEDLLAAVGEQYFNRLREGMAAAIKGLRGPARLDAALVSLTEFQLANPITHMSDLEPGYFLRRLQELLPELEKGLLPLLTVDGQADAAHARSLAGLISRVAISHALLPDPDPGALLRELRTAARLA